MERVDRAEVAGAAVPALGSGTTGKAPALLTRWSGTGSPSRPETFQGLADLEPEPMPARRIDAGKAPALLTRWSGSRSGNGPNVAKVIKRSPVPEC